jgi:hypothetical protein
MGSSLAAGARAPKPPPLLADLLRPAPTQA